MAELFTVLQTFYIFFQEAERIEQVKQNKHAQKLNDILFLSREKNHYFLPWLSCHFFLVVQVVISDSVIFV